MTTVISDELHTSPYPMSGAIPEQSYQVQNYTNVGHCPAWPLMPRAVTELDNSGFGFRPYAPPLWNDAAMVAFDEAANVIGFLTYRYDEPQCAWFILLAWVHEKHRRKGVHTAMFNALVERAKARGDILAVNCGTHIDNIAAQAAFEAQGRVKNAVMYTVRIKDWLDGSAAYADNATPITGVGEVKV